jgi:serine/threonine protein kinase
MITARHRNIGKNGQGGVRREILPANIMSNRQGIVKTTDFAIAGIAGGGRREERHPPVYATEAGAGASAGPDLAAGTLFYKD